MKEANWRDHMAFWLFGMSNSFAFIVMLTAAQDIMSDKRENINEPKLHLNQTIDVDQCEPFIDKRECRVQALGAVLLANVLPVFFIKTMVPFVMHRLPFSLLHIIVCLCQALSYLIVSSTTSIQMSLFGVVFSSIASGLGDICYLALASHYHRDSISWWSSGTGGSGILASITYAAMTEPHLAGLSPKITLLLMLIVPLEFLVTYFFILTPASTVYSPKLLSPKTWLIPHKHHKNHSINDLSKELGTDQKPLVQYEVVDKERQQVKVNPNLLPMSMAAKARTVLSLFKYIIPLTAVYFFDFVVNQGLTTFMIFDCAHGLGLSAVSQYRWYQVIYCFGSFIARSSTNFVRLPYVFLMIFPLIGFLNATFCLFNSLYFFIPQIWMVFGLIFVEGLIGGGAYANTYNRIHKEVDPSIKAFALSITTMSDVVGILLAGLSTMPIHSIVCSFYAQI